MTVMNEYKFTAADFADWFGITSKTLNKKAQALGLGIDLGGRRGYRYSEADRVKLVESMRPAAPVKPRRRRRVA